MGRKGLLLLLLLASCARYGVESPRLPNRKEPEVVVRQNYLTVYRRLKRHLERRKIPFKVHWNNAKALVDLEMTWMKDQSVSHFYIQRGQRTPHLAHWKGVWRIQQITSRKARVRLETMELIFLGPTTSAPPHHLIDGQWVEIDDKNWRSRLELRRFWLGNYSTRTLPRSLAQLESPTVEFPPLIQDDFRDLTLQNQPRPAAF